MPLQPVLDSTVTEVVTAVRGVTPDQFDLPTPCQGWDVRALTNHLIQVIRALGLAGRERSVPATLWSRDLMSHGWADRLDEEARTAVAAWVPASAWDGTARMGDAALPATAVATMLVSDLVIHGWDLTRATGQRYRCGDEAAEVARRFVTDMGEQGRQMGLFAAPHSVTHDAPALDQALALSGRNPRWAPAPT